MQQRIARSASIDAAANNDRDFRFQQKAISALIAANKVTSACTMH
jgi:hypothetical protein